MAPTVHKFKVFEDSGAVIMARITAADGTNLTQAATSSITYKVFDNRDLTTPTTSGTLTVSSVIYDTLQTDSRWDADSTGYNFAWEVPASVFVNGDRKYIIELLVTPGSGEQFHVVFQGTTLPIYGS